MKLKHIVLFVLIVVFGLSCSEPSDFVRLPGTWNVVDDEVQLYGISGIDQAIVDKDAPIPTTLEFSITDPIQFNYVQIWQEGSQITLDLLDDPDKPNYRLHLLRTERVNEIRFYIGDVLYTSSLNLFTFDKVTAELSIDSVRLYNWPEHIDLSGSVIFSHDLLEAGKLALMDKPDPANYPKIDLETLELNDNKSCALTLATLPPSLPQLGTWSYQETILTCVLQNETLSYSFDIDNDMLYLEAEADELNSSELLNVEVNYGLLQGSIISAYSISSSKFERELVVPQ